ncbi:MAG: TPM domain-containing protein [Haliscomenobacter sp.]
MQIRQIVHWAFLLGIGLVLPAVCRAQEGTVFTVQTVPDPKKQGSGYVSDPGRILSAGAVDSLNQLIASMESATTAQMAVVVLPSIGEDSPKEFATALFEAWGIGQADVDNGLLILTVMDQRRTEFETGYGLEGVLPDITCYRVGMEELVPFFQQANYGQGLIAAVTRFKAILENPDAAEEIRSSQSTDRKKGIGAWIGIGVYGLLNILLVGFLLAYIIGVLRSKEDVYDKYQRIAKAGLIFLIVIFPLSYSFLYIWIRRKLQVLRRMPRYSRKTGALMHLVSEQEEDAYLQKGQITEEEIGSADYDVWTTEAGDDLLILRYSKNGHKFSKCPQCKFTTYSLVSSTTLRSATRSSTGLRRESYACKNCHFTREKEVVLPMITSSDSSSSGGGGGGSWGGGSSGGGGSGVSW